MKLNEIVGEVPDGDKGKAGCSMGVGCDEAGVCYAMAHGQPELCAAPQAECAPRWAQPVGDTVRECLSDVVSHYRALYAGLAFQLNEATNTENSDDMAYWKHEIKALERMYVQAESALAAPTPERAECAPHALTVPVYPSQKTRFAMRDAIANGANVDAIYAIAVGQAVNKGVGK